jgi:pimeloyl-ACP methyl ester carboxylesterase
MERLRSSSGPIVSYERCGSGPPLVLVHGSFSDHHTNWEFVKPMLQERFTLYTIARRGRGDTEATNGHRLEDEARDLASVIDAVGQPVFLLGHSYGAQCALAAALLARDRIRKLVLYEAPWPAIVTDDALVRFERLASSHAWGELAVSFFRDTLFVPAEEIAAVRETELWPPIVSDAKASLGDIRALHAYDFDASRFRALDIPVLLQFGSASPRQRYVSGALAAVLPDAQLGELEGQAHEGMTTAPRMYADAVIAFLLGGQLKITGTPPEPAQALFAAG